jgi:hypothetical protein
MVAKKSSNKPAAKETPNLPAIAAPANLAAMMPAGFKVKKQVILPTLSLQVNAPKTLVITGPMYQSTYTDPDPKKAKEKPATVVPVGDVETGEAMNLLVPSVMESALNEGYPGGDYVGKTFMVCKMPKRPGKRYFDIKLVEVEAE